MLNSAPPPSSPTKTELQRKAALLPALERKKREKIGQGEQSLILANGHTKVLMVTRYLVAKKIELLRSRVAGDPRSKSLALPDFVAMDQDLAALIDPNNPDKVKKEYKFSFNILPAEIWTKNFVYQLPRYEGSLEDCKGALRYKEDSIDALEIFLYDVIDLLHENNLTHNDISLKNIFYSGTYPNLQFHLGDFGSLSDNPPKQHPKKCEKDYKDINHVIEQLKQILRHKRNIVAQRADYVEHPYFKLRRAQKLGVSPLKEIQVKKSLKEDNTKETNGKNSSIKKRLVY